MTPEQKAAYVVAQAALLNAEIEGMKACNTERDRAGYSLAYGESDFSQLYDSYDKLIGHNALMELFKE